MKKIRVTFACLAVLLACLGAFAKKPFATKYYRAYVYSWSGARCDVEISEPPCAFGPGTQCIDSRGYLVQYPGMEEPQTFYNFYVSKKVDGGECEVVTRIL